MACGFDVEAYGETLLGAGEVDDGGAEDAVEHCVGVVQWSGVASEPVQHLLLDVERHED